MKITKILLAGIIVFGLAFLLAFKNPFQEQRAEQSGEQAKHLNGKQEREISQVKQKKITPSKRTKTIRMTQEQETIMEKAMRSPGTDAVKSLLQTMDVNATTEEGGTLLYRAVQYQRVDIVELLLKKGANVNAALTVEDDDWRGSTPLDAALEDTIFRPLYYFASPKEWEETLQETVKKDSGMDPYVRMLKLLIKHGAKSGFVPNSDRRTVRPKDLSEKEWTKKQKQITNINKNDGRKKAEQNPPSDSAQNQAVATASIPSGQPKAQIRTRSIEKQPAVDFHTAPTKATLGQAEEKNLQHKFIHICRGGTVEEAAALLEIGADVNEGKVNFL